MEQFAKKRISLSELTRLKKILRQARLHTVCESALCPNIGECFCKGTATFLIAGDICTRGCRFCAVTKGTPLALDPDESRRIALTAKELGLRYAVITSVTRDDLNDGGAGHFAAAIAELRSLMPDLKIEVLVPDFGGSRAAAEAVFNARPDVFAHNIETVPRLYGIARSTADYRRSLDLIGWAKGAGLTTKSGIMLGLGEREAEILTAMDDLRSAGCDILTIGQYLAPSKSNYPVQSIIPDEQFSRLKNLALDKGFLSCASGSYVRSSYLAESMLP